MFFDLNSSCLEFVLQLFDCVLGVGERSFKINNIPRQLLNSFLLPCQLQLQITYPSTLISAITLQLSNLHPTITQICCGFIQVLCANTQLFGHVTELIIENPCMLFGSGKLMVQIISLCCQIGFVLSKAVVLFFEVLVVVDEDANLHVLLCDFGFCIVEIVFQVTMSIFKILVIAIKASQILFQVALFSCQLFYLSGKVSGSLLFMVEVTIQFRDMCSVFVVTSGEIGNKDTELLVLIEG